MENLKVRTDKFKTFLRSEYGENHERPVAIVGHSLFFKYLTASDYSIDEETGLVDYTQEPGESIFLNNCEFLSIDNYILWMAWNLYESSLFVSKLAAASSLFNFIHLRN